VADHFSLWEEAIAIGVIGVVVRVDEIPHPAPKPFLDKLLDLSGFGWEWQGIDQGSAIRPNHGTGCHLRIQLAGEHVDIVRNPLFLHSKSPKALRLYSIG